MPLINVDFVIGNCYLWMGMLQNILNHWSSSAHCLVPEIWQTCSCFLVWNEEQKCLKHKEYLLTQQKIIFKKPKSSGRGIPLSSPAVRYPHPVLAGEVPFAVLAEGSTPIQSWPGGVPQSRPSQGTHLPIRMLYSPHWDWIGVLPHQNWMGVPSVDRQTDRQTDWLTDSETCVKALLSPFFRNARGNEVNDKHSYLQLKYKTCICLSLCLSDCLDDILSDKVGGVKKNLLKV